MRAGEIHVAARHAEEAVKARVVAQQVMRGDHDVFASTPLLVVSRTVLALTTNRNLKGTGTSDCSTSGTEHWRNRTGAMVNRYFGCLEVATPNGLGQGILLSEQHGTSKTSKL